MSKVSKRRACPALGQDISSADCGEKRQSQLPCPPECVHNPFALAHYSQLLELEGQLDRRSMDKLAGCASGNSQLFQDLSQAQRQGLLATHAAYAWNLFFLAGPDGLTFARRWEQTGLTELKNDERVLLRAKMQMRIALLEVHRVLAGGQIEAIDLLSPDPVPLIFQDLNVAKMAVRFTTLLSWTYPLPHYWRLSGTSLPVVPVPGLTATEVVREIVQHSGGPLTEPEMRRWLAEHFVEFNNVQYAVAQLRRQQRLAGMDAKFGKAIYELRAPFAKCRERLDESPDLEPDDLEVGEVNEGFATAFAWFDDSATASDDNQVLGRLLIGQSQCRLQTIGADKLSHLRRQFEHLLGDLVCFVYESVDDLAAHLQSEKAVVHESRVPSRLLENPDQVSISSSRVPVPPGLSPEDAASEAMRVTQRAFLDEPVPLLSNHTPWEAARDPVLRLKLVQLLKESVRGHDERNLETGRADDINWLLRELGLSEMIFDPPPWRPPLPAPADNPVELPEDVGFEVDPNRLPPPPLPEEPFDLKESDHRLGTALELFELAADAEDEIYASGATLFEDAEDLVLDRLTEQDFYFAIPFLLQVWFAFVPCGCRAPEISFEALEINFAANLRQFENCLKAGSRQKLESFLQNSSQPEFMLVLAERFFEGLQAVPKENLPGLATHPVILALLKSVAEQLDEALRK